MKQELINEAVKESIKKKRDSLDNLEAGKESDRANLERYQARITNAQEDIDEITEEIENLMAYLKAQEG